MKPLRLFGFLLLAFAPAFAQDEVSWDNSGNSLLQGAYNYREVVWVAADEAGNLERSVAFTGTIEFDGEGGYTLSARVMDSREGVEQNYNTTGSYRIAASGFGFLTSPVREDGSVYGLVSRGIFIGSSTDSQINDLFIAAPAGATGVEGRYRVAEMNFPSLTMSQARDALYDLNFDGQGSTGTVSATGYIGGNARRVSQTINGASYTFTGGTGAISFGGTLTDSNLLAGSRTLFSSPDGSFIFGGATNGWNMFVGVRPLSGAASNDALQGLYYQAGVDADLGDLASGRATLHTYYGAFTAGAGVQINHQRLLDGVDDLPVDYTFSDTYEVNPSGVYEDFLGFQNIIGSDGGIRIGFGVETTPGISVALKAPELSGEGVFLHPAGIRNAASGTPLTVGIVPGELLNLAGSGFPATPDGVQVMFNGRPAAVREVSPEKIVAVVPFETQGPIVRVQVITAGGESKPVTMFTATTAPGVFTEPAGGAGFAQAFHPDGSPVTAANPARPGGTISAMATGLGIVDPAIADGVAAPEDPRSRAKAEIAAFVDNRRATVEFAGLAPGLIGIYRIDLQIPQDVRNGNRYLDVAGPDSYSSQVQIPIAGASTAGDVRAAERPGRLLRTRPRMAPRPGVGQRRRP
ncbi:MAG: IPT/TIG domain-containing protein [Bryobacteraceae bacterium]|nr:IPT/TIG domain-containing protein [Bryobacteraceae bacterium]